MGILEQRFVQDFLRTANDGWSCGWHEANGGNLSYRLDGPEKAYVKRHTKHGGWKSLPPACKVAGLAGECLMISASGSHFRSMDHSPKACTGIIEIDSKGSAYRHLWGFKGKGRPTCELVTHLMLQEIKKEQTKGRTRIVYHAHPSNIIALSSMASSSEVLTQKLWASMSEAAIIFPDGIGLLEWMVPGSIELGIATCREMIYHDAVVWAHHGLIVTGDTFDRAFGLVQTIEKAAGINIQMRQMGAKRSDFISLDDLRRLSEAFSLDLDLVEDQVEMPESFTPNDSSERDAMADSSNAGMPGSTEKGSSYGTISISIV